MRCFWVCDWIWLAKKDAGMVSPLWWAENGNAWSLVMLYVDMASYVCWKSCSVSHGKPTMMSAPIDIVFWGCIDWNLVNISFRMVVL